MNARLSACCMRDGCSPTLCTACHWHIAHLVARHDSLPYNVDYVYQLYCYVGPQGFDRCSLLWFSSSKRKGVQTQPCVIECIAMAARTRTKEVVQLEEEKGIEACDIACTHQAGVSRVAVFAPHEAFFSSS